MIRTELLDRLNSKDDEDLKYLHKSSPFNNFNDNRGRYFLQNLDKLYEKITSTKNAKEVMRLLYKLSVNEFYSIAGEKFVLNLLNHYLEDDNKLCLKDIPAPWVKQDVLSSLGLLYLIQFGYGIPTTYLTQHMEKDKIQSKESHYSYIPGSVGKFLSLMERAFKYNGVNNETKFLDAGCGVGDKLHLASLFFDKVYGVEYDAKNIHAYHYLHQRFNTYKNRKQEQTVTEGNILNLDYSEFDLIYSYVPMSETSFMYQFGKRILKTAKPGTLIIELEKTQMFSELLKKSKKAVAEHGCWRII